MKQNYAVPSASTFGFEWTHELEEGIVANLDKISCMEIIPENFFEGRFSHFLDLLEKTGVPVAVHGVLLSIGSLTPLKTEHLDKILDLVKRINMVNFSEHLSLTEVGEVNLDALTPLAWTRDVADIVCQTIEQIQDRLNVPFLIENVSNRFMIPDVDFSETEFINYVLKKTGCGLLLDVTNVYTNSQNFSFDPKKWIDEIDLTRVQLVHLAGGFSEPDGFLMDSHDNTVAEGSWELYRYAVEKSPPFATIIERTGNFPRFEELSGELDKAKAIVDDVRGVAHPPLISRSESAPQITL